jgi:hypothetical protein
MPFLHEKFCFLVNYLSYTHCGPKLAAIDVPAMRMCSSSFAPFEVSLNMDIQSWKQQF